MVLGLTRPRYSAAAAGVLQPSKFLSNSYPVLGGGFTLAPRNAGTARAPPVAGGDLGGDAGAACALLSTSSTKIFFFAFGLASSALLSTSSTKIFFFAFG